MDEPPSFLRFFVCFVLVSCICVGGFVGVSAGFVSGYRYTWHYRAWEDYCPACGHHDCLLMNPKGVPESELTCSVCGADYCGVTGWDKGGKRWRLIRAPVLGCGVDLQLHYSSFMKRY